MQDSEEGQILPSSICFFFFSPLSSRGWQDGCHILNIMTISQGLFRELPAVQHNYGDSQALCLLQVSNSPKKSLISCFGIGVYSGGVGSHDTHRAGRGCSVFWASHCELGDPPGDVFDSVH